MTGGKKPGSSDISSAETKGYCSTVHSIEVNSVLNSSVTAFGSHLSVKGTKYDDSNPDIFSVKSTARESWTWDHQKP